MRVTPMPVSLNLRAALIALCAYAAFSTHDTLIKSLGGTYAAPQVIFFSVLLSFPLLSTILIYEKAAVSLRPRYPGWVALRSVAVITTALTVFYAFSQLPMAQVYAVLFATPLLITILSIPVLGEKVGIHRGGAVVAGLIGVLIVLRPGTAELQLGHAAAVLGALGSATAAVVARRIGQTERSAVLLLYPMMGHIVVMGALMPGTYEPMPLIDLAKTGGIAVLGFIGMGLMILAYRVGEAAVVAPMQYSQLIWAMIYGAIFFGEGVDGMTLLGAGVIILSGVYILWRESRASVSENRPVSASRARPDTGTVVRVPTEMLEGLEEKARSL